MPYLVIIAGPTAVGKTDIGIRLAKEFGTVILSADSRQFYRELTIGTAKPTEEQLNAVKHYFINNKSIHDLYGAGHYEKDAIKCLDELFMKHKLVFMVGGSGLYIDAVVNGVDEFSEIPRHIRSKINEEYKKNGLRWLQESLKKCDPNYFTQVDENNSQRMVRALEVYEYTGKPFSSFLTRSKSKRNFKVVKLLLNLNRVELYDRINKRVDRMIEAGLVDEAKKFSDFKNLNALRTVGYKELNEHFEGKYSLEDAIEKIKQHTRNYAKRQLTWFKNKDKFDELDAKDYALIKKSINDQISHA